MFFVIYKLNYKSVKRSEKKKLLKIIKKRSEKLSFQFAGNEFFNVFICFVISVLNRRMFHCV